ncbi:MAG: ATP-binding protein [Actinomycetaceae bacterium]|nr:ATP-binding protein [Actinomycetaceae bacterium]MDY6082258.1 ATP-binding protein [Actinomycetaceae bacterium]
MSGIAGRNAHHAPQTEEKNAGILSRLQRFIRPRTSRTLRSRILLNMVAATAIALILGYGLTAAVFYRGARSDQIASVQKETNLLAAAIETSSGAIDSMLDSFAKNEPGYRVTLIEQDGTVVYDSVADPSTMENHANRPEVRAAEASGVGEATRDSHTLQESMYYYAKRVQHGQVIRVARATVTMLAAWRAGLPALTAIAGAMILLAALMARHQARVIVEPLEQIDVENPLNNDAPGVYVEFIPLLERIDARNDQNRQAEQSRQEFSANVSHELKTPLTSISGYAEIIRDGLVQQQDISEFSGRIYAESQRLLQLIDDIMALSKLDEQSLESYGDRRAVGGAWAPVDLFETAKSVTTRLADKAERYRVQIQLTGSTVQVDGIEALVDQMVFNIVENAIKYNHEGGHVYVWAGQMRGKPAVIVEDDGIGISEDDQAHIFERFYRADKSRSKERGGTGLGLSIVKHAAEVLGATVEVDSTIGSGTRMEVVFD